MGGPRVVELHYMPQLAEPYYCALIYSNLVCLTPINLLLLTRFNFPYRNKNVPDAQYQ